MFSLPQMAAGQTGTQAQCDAYLAKQSLRQLAIAAALAGFCTWRIRRPA